MDMRYNNEEHLKSLISRYRQKVFALILYLVGGDQDKTYDICAASFAEAVHARASFGQDEVILTGVIGAAIEKTRATKAIPVSNEFELLDLPDAEKGPLHVVLKALQALDFNAKALVLLRDQLNLSYKQIAIAMHISETNAISKTAQARVQLRKKIEETINHA